MHFARLSLTQRILRVLLLPVLFYGCSTPPPAIDASHPATPEALIRAMFHANEMRNMADLERVVGGRVTAHLAEPFLELLPELQPLRLLDPCL